MTRQSDSGDAETLPAPVGFPRVEFEEMHLTRERGWEITARHPAFVNLTGELVKFFRENRAENYIELTLWHEDTGPLVLTLQRQEGKTPGQLVQELRARIAELENMACVEMEDAPL